MLKKRKCLSDHAGFELQLDTMRAPLEQEEEKERNLQLKGGEGEASSRQVLVDKEWQEAERVVNGTEEEGEASKRMATANGTWGAVEDIELAGREGATGAQGRSSSQSVDGGEGKTFLLAASHLLAMASLGLPPPQPCAFWRRAAASVRSIQHVAASSVLLPDAGVRGILACLPLLMSRGPKSMAIKGAALLGTLAINSYKIAWQVARDKVLLFALFNLLEHKDLAITMEVYHCAVNLVISAEGRAALRDLGAVEKLMISLSWSAGSIWHDLTAKSVEGHDCKSVIFDIVDALDALIFHDSSLSLESIPVHVRVSAFGTLQTIWRKLCDEKHPLLKGELGQRLPNLIIWLALELEAFEDVDVSADTLLKSLFEEKEVDVEHFLIKHWESLPCIWNEVWQCADDGLLGKALREQEESAFLKKLLVSCLSCPPFSSDELEPLRIFEEMQRKLNKLMILGQDVRLVKSTPSHPFSTQAAVESDYHNNVSGLLEAVDVETCVQAYKRGYTVALRGMEFRCRQVAATTEILAIWFGQASAGANLYMTPPHAQGFALHADDHCVLVRQLLGSKLWELFPPTSSLPRLYSQKLKAEGDDFESKDAWSFLLKQGDVLYIPRGFPHKASTKRESLNQYEPGAESSSDLLSTDNLFEHTMNCDGTSEHPVQRSSPSSKTICKCVDDYKHKRRILSNMATHSVHITFGVEVEPPFDWEGLVHMSLDYWMKQQRTEEVFGSTEASKDSVKGLFELSTGLLHVAIRCCGNEYSVFRKACLIAAKCLDQKEHCFSSQFGSFESVFRELMIIVMNTANFKVALDEVMDAIDTLDGTPLDWMCWLRHLPCNDENGSSFWADPRLFFCERLSECISNRNLKDLEASFVAAKSSFITHSNFAEACVLFRSLLEKYRGIRKRFTEGMLALHNQSKSD